MATHNSYHLLERKGVSVISSSIVYKCDWGTGVQVENIGLTFGAGNVNQSVGVGMRVQRILSYDKDIWL